ncbi:retrotransposon hot spot (RHS) protein, partial [Trypanosoma cruzi]
ILTEYQVYKLHHKGVFFLEQWRDYERKDTVTPLARGKLNAAFTQIQRESREAEERLRGTQEMKFTISTTIEFVLFTGIVRVMEVKLNQLIKRRFDGKALWTSIGMS